MPEAPIAPQSPLQPQIVRMALVLAGQLEAHARRAPSAPSSTPASRSSSTGVASPSATASPPPSRATPTRLPQRGGRLARAADRPRPPPFLSFTVELVGGTRIEVDHPEAMVFRGGVAVYVSQDGTPTSFDRVGVGQSIGVTDATAG